MLLKDFIKQHIDIDVCDDYDESIYIAFVGPVKLTPQGKQKYDDIMDVEITVHDDMAIITIDNDKQAIKCNDFFLMCAGYCSYQEYDYCIESED